MENFGSSFFEYIAASLLLLSLAFVIGFYILMCVVNPRNLLFIIFLVPFVVFVCKGFVRYVFKELV